MLSLEIHKDIKIQMNKLKENLYSRQIGALGKDVMLKLSNLTIQILGTNTLGLEIAKSLTLMGVKRIYLCNNDHKFYKNFALKLGTFDSKTIEFRSRPRAFYIS